MSALSLIRDYGDDQDTSEESDTQESINLRKRKLPTPNLSGVSVVLSEEHVDDPTLHNGRTRTFPHVRGNWATFVYIDYPNKENLSEIIDKLQSALALVEESCIVIDDVHISLSRTFVLRYHMIKSFTESLQKVVSNSERFDLSFDSVEVFCNEEETRTFVALGVDTISNGYLVNILKGIDNLLEDFKVSKFYENPTFHMSILSVNGDKRKLISNLVTDLNDILMNDNNKSLKSEHIYKVHCKSGNRVYQYFLNNLKNGQKY